MGRALAASKLESIKTAMETLTSNFLSEGEAIRSSMKKMVGKHAPSQMEDDKLEMLGLKTDEVISEIPKVNELEQILDIQVADPELAMIEKKIKDDLELTKSSFAEGNTQIHQKLDEPPEDARIVSDQDYSEKMSFVLKH